MTKYYLAYARKSTEGEEKQVNSIPDQIDVINEIVDKKHLPVLEIYSESKSAKSPGRKEFNRMVETIYKRGDIKGIICFHLNRLTRNPIDCATLQWMLQNHVIDEIVTSDKTYIEEDSDYIMAFEGAGATKFIKDLRKSTARGIDAKIKRGIAPISAPVGYENSKTKKQGENDIAPHPIYFEQVKKLLRLFVTGDYSGNDILQKAREMGIKTSRGSCLSKTQTYAILRNPFYAGKFYYRGELHDGAHTPMITWTEYQLIQDVLDGRKRTQVHSHKMLNGLVKCTECGLYLTGDEKDKHQKNGNVNHFEYYPCNGSRHHKCNQKAITGEKLKTQMKLFLDYLEIDPEYIQWSLKQIRKNHELESGQTHLLNKQVDREIAGLQTQLSNLTRLKISPLNVDGAALSDDEFLEQKNRLKVEIKSAEERKSKLIERQFNWVDLTEKTYHFCQTAAEVFKNGSVEKKKYLMRVFGANLELNNGILEVTPRGPFKIVKEYLDAQREMFEPTKRIDTSIEISSLDFKNSVWGG